MTLPLTYGNFQNHLLTSLFKRSIVRNIHQNLPQRGRALVYFKTDPFVPFFLHNYTHSTLWDITCLVRVLTRFGYAVDVVDRKISSSFLPEDGYDLFIGLGSDDSGQYFPRYAKQLSRATKILLATSAHPVSRNSNVAARATALEKRSGIKLPLDRRVSHLDHKSALQHADAIFCFGNDTTISTYRPHTKLPIYRLYPSTSPHLALDGPALNDKQPSHFLFFSGTGNLLKGVDLLLETFAQLPEVTLHLCTTLHPETLKQYQSALKLPNIIQEGFIMVGGDRFTQLTRQCNYVILPSCSEGTATSVTTCMRRGLTPVVTLEAGIDTGQFGITITDTSIPALIQQIRSLTTVSPAQQRHRTIATYRASFQYTQESFEKSFTEALVAVLDSPEAIT